MTLNPGCEAEYERRHSPIWSDLARVLKAHGASNYSIFLDRGTGRLFGYVEIEDAEKWAAVARTSECRRWWTHMADIIVHESDGAPVSLELAEVFHLK